MRKRVRQVRRDGITGFAALDWREAITGVQPTRAEIVAAAPPGFTPAAAGGYGGLCDSELPDG